MKMAAVSNVRFSAEEKLHQEDIYNSAVQQPPSSLTKVEEAIFAVASDMQCENVEIVSKRCVGQVQATLQLAEVNFDTQQ